MKSQLPGSGKEVQKDAEVAKADISSRADQVAKDAKAGVDKADAYRRDAQAELNKGIKNTEKELKEGVDKFDKTVTEVSALLPASGMGSGDANEDVRAGREQGEVRYLGLVRWREEVRKLLWL